MDDHTDRAFTRAERLSRISTLLHAAPHGLSTAELARLCGVSQRTIQRDLVSLETLGIPVTESGEHPPRYTMVEGCYIPPVRLSLHEALALNLAARL
ncbi:MAG TPA: HTH domain-containing protein, partial [Chloroflexi bacterium]|nr:HTH domain-containing protein [Chloroflexota bacterium]